jgi:hypothetical protein
MSSGNPFEADRTSTYHNYFCWGNARYEEQLAVDDVEI